MSADDDYVISACSLSKETKECGGGCSQCDDAKNQKIKEEEENKKGYQFEDITVNIGEKKFSSNNKQTVAKIPLEEIEYVKLHLRIPIAKKITHEFYTMSILDETYPEWEVTKELHGLADPNYYLFEPNCAIIVVYDDIAYAVAPRLEQD